MPSGIRIHGAADLGKHKPDTTTVHTPGAAPSPAKTSLPILRIRGAAQASTESPTPPPSTPSEGTNTPVTDQPSLPASSSRNRLAGLPRSLKSSITAHLSTSAAAPGAASRPRKKLEDRILGADAAVLRETRARVADRRGEAVAGVQPHMATLEASEEEEKISARSSPGKKGGEGAVGEVAGKEVNGLRQALLDRLERERLTAAKSDGVPHQEVKSNGTMTKNKAEDAGPETDAEKNKENRLRQQAHLRARLARAKQEVGTLVNSASAESGLVGDVNRQQDGKVHDVDLDAVEQEAKLRLTLSRARRAKV
jgi:hypothetical protein